MKLKLVARPRTPYVSRHSGNQMYEQVELVEVTFPETNPEGYCLGIMHVDTFYGDQSIYDRLIVGEAVNMVLSEEKPEHDE